MKKLNIGENEVLNALMSNPERQAKTTKNALLDLITKVEDKLYKKTNKLIYEVSAELDDACRDALDSKNEAQMQEAMVKLRSFKF